MVTCQLCSKTFKVITNTHLKSIHQNTITQYTKQFGNKGCGFLISASSFPKNDSRYQKWHFSLRKRPSPWNKGQSKQTHSSLAKLSRTLRRKKIDNLARWRSAMIDSGGIRSYYPKLARTFDLAVLTGLVLGDGHIQKYPRVDRLIIALNTKYPGLIHLTKNLLSRVFQTEASITLAKNKNCARVGIYQKYISKRLRVPSGNRRYSTTGIPRWVWQSRIYIIGCLKGLFEAEGSLSIHLPTYTYNFAFTNRNQTLLDNVEKGLRILNFHPEVRSDKIRLRKKHEVFAFKKLISFRDY